MLFPYPPNIYQFKVTIEPLEKGVAPNKGTKATSVTSF